MKKVLIILGAVIVLLLLLGACTDTPEEDEPKETGAMEKSQKAERIKDIESAFKSHHISVEKMSQAKESAKEGDEEKAKALIQAASMFNEIALNALNDLPPKDEPELIEYRSSIYAQLSIYAAAIDGVQKIAEEGISVQKAFDEFYDKKTGQELKELEELNAKLGDFK
jgi:hypothetical protein